MNIDPYVISDATVREQPFSFFQKLKFLGPGFILSASIVGSGELIATTILGAKAGFVALWIIVISCLAKVAVQLEFGKHAVLTGETVMQAFNKLPGPKWGKARWPVWTLFVFLLLKIVQLGGMLGGTVVILNMLYSGVSILAWTFIVVIVVAALIYNGRYSSVEKISLFMIAMFTLLTLASLFALRFTPFDFSFSDVLHNQRFNLSGEVIGYAIGAFGITGVASDEILAYNYWCLEKGYASYTGPKRETEEWRRRAKGWINVMYLDAFVAMVIYTVVTVAFYLLGAAILHQRGEIPEGNGVIETLALIYTQTLGPGIKTAYLVGGFFVLFSSLFASLAFWTRAFSDIAGQIGWINFFDIDQRRKLIAVLAWTIPFTWVAAYLYLERPVLMVFFGGMVGSFMLFIVIAGALHFKYIRTQMLESSAMYTIAFWISIISIFVVGIAGLASLFG